MTPKHRLWLIAAVIWSAWYTMDPEARSHSVTIDSTSLDSHTAVLSMSPSKLTDHGFVLGAPR